MPQNCRNSHGRPWRRTSAPITAPTFSASFRERNSAPRLQVYCLGDFRVERDRAVLSDSAWKSKRAKTVLKMLLAQDDHKLLRDQVIEMLWPDDDPEKQRMAYNVMLHRMRKALEPDAGPEPGKDVFCIQNEHDVLALNSARVWTDVG